ncbi:MAG: glutamate 5-kinase [Campylobacteraceae bacterium]|jgi:glutamate 5-kinase|nr:glutamate 5-kinase [Campylobacteraceae bacterium]
MKSRIVIKVGTHVIYEDGKIERERFSKVVDFISELMEKYEVIVVTSGAVASGYSKIKLDKSIVKNRQALAAIGQPYLIREYNDLLEKNGYFGAQLLVIADDFDSRKKTKRVRDAVDALIEHKILPIINENDTTAIEELVFGDNDQLSARITHFLGADLLVILSDIDGYYDKDPRENSDAVMNKNIYCIDEKELVLPYNAGTTFGTGGIVTKLKAANFLLQHSRAMFLTSGFDLKDLRSFLLEKNHQNGTLFSPKNWKI